AGFKSRKSSMLLKRLGSVPSSGQPVWLVTFRISGNFPMISRSRFAVLTASSSETDVGKTVALSQMLPSSRAGKNSEPTLDARKQVSAKDARASSITTLGCSKDHSRVGL